MMGGKGVLEGEEGPGNPPDFRDPSNHNKTFRLGIPDPQLIPQVGSGDLAIWLSYRT